MQDHGMNPNPEMTEDNLNGISLLELFQMLLRHAKLIVILAILGAIISYIVTSFFITPMYASEIKLYVNNAKASQAEVITSADIAASKSLVDTYIAIMQSNTVIEEVIRSTGLPYTQGQIKSMMEAAAVNKTEIFYVKIVNEDPKEAMRIANAFSSVATKKISEYVEGSSVKIIDKATEAKNPFSPRRSVNVAIGFLAGVIAAVTAAFVMEMTDTRVTSEEQLARIKGELAGGYPVIGRIPDLSALDKGMKYGYYRKEEQEKPERRAAKRNV